MKYFTAALGTVAGFLIAAAAPVCAGPIYISNATLVALGSTHGYAEYAIRLGDQRPASKSIFLIELDCTTVDGKTSIVNVSPTVVSQISYSKQFAIFLKDPDLQSIEIKYYVANGKSGSMESDSDRFVLGQPDLVTPLVFDDTQAWLASIPAVYAFREPRDSMNGVASKIPPDYPSEAYAENARGSVEVTVDLNADGSVFRVDLTASSGYALLDEAVVTAALETKYDSALLVTPGGDVPTANRFHSYYEFAGQQ